MEHIDTGIIRHCLFHTGERIKQKLIELVIFHVVILDFACGALIIHIIRRIGYHKVCFLAIHKQGIAFLLGAVPTKQSVVAKQPEVTCFCDRRLP